MVSRPILERRAPEPHFVCEVGEFSTGEVKSVRAGGKRIAVACLPDGSFRAVADTCPHEAARLSEGVVESMWVADEVSAPRASGERCVIVCPWHNFEFDLESGHSTCEPRRMRIKTYPVEVEDGEVFLYT